MEPMERAKQFSAENKCIICEKQFSRLTRGLCSVHHAIWLDARAKLNESDAIEMDDMLIKEGELLPDGRRKTDSFAEKLARYIASKNAVQLDSIDRDAAEIEQAANKHAAKAAAKKPKKTTKKKQA